MRIWKLEFCLKKNYLNVSKVNLAFMCYYIINTFEDFTFKWLFDDSRGKQNFKIGEMRMHNEIFNSDWYH